MRCSESEQAAHAPAPINESNPKPYTRMHCPESDRAADAPAPILPKTPSPWPIFTRAITGSHPIPWHFSLFSLGGWHRMYLASWQLSKPYKTASPFETFPFHFPSQSSRLMLRRRGGIQIILSDLRPALRLRLNLGLFPALRL